MRPADEAQAAAGPVITPGAAGATVETVTASVEAALVPQPLVAVTEILPAALPEVTVTDMEPCPAVMVHPAGTDHVYEPAPGTAVMEYMRPADEAHAAAGPVIAPGAAGATVETVTASVEAALVPQPLAAVTEMLPAALPDVTVMDMVPCPAVMVHPAGTVHVYDEAPGTAVIE